MVSSLSHIPRLPRAFRDLSFVDPVMEKLQARAAKLAVLAIPFSSRAKQEGAVEEPPNVQ
ncbi:hypothetical protein IHQ71_21515 [Rhizobium sp. TH2]|uniref:hypothetical protein n=1 Tax=Rhizobium sp. TH2 TaxID=2775403 RepID=UPI0021575E70|nr:hypothetical protein [Rhizobium sp. TH2]UVC07744.1 hypothetical protein IHQ71_21515 [Rhizobium sp. TH2]